MQSDWLRTFWPISQEQKFYQIWDLCGSTAHNINVHYRSTSVKINDQIFQQIKKLFLALFGFIFSILGAKKILPGIPALSRTTSCGFLVPCQNLEKNNDTTPRKCPDRGKDGRKDVRMDRPYFIGPLRLSPGVQYKLIISLKLANIRNKTW